MGGVEGGETVARIYCMREEYILKSNTIKNIAPLVSFQFFAGKTFLYWKQIPDSTKYLKENNSPTYALLYNLYLKNRSILYKLNV